MFDAYRPLRAVEDFVFWSKDIRDTKPNYYPNVDKADFFDLAMLVCALGTVEALRWI